MNTPACLFAANESVEAVTPPSGECFQPLICSVVKEQPHPLDAHAAAKILKTLRRFGHMMSLIRICVCAEGSKLPKGLSSEPVSIRGEDSKVIPQCSLITEDALFKPAIPLPHSKHSILRNRMSELRQAW